MMDSRRSSFASVKLAVAAVMLLGLAACTQSFNADVSRFQAQLPAPSGQTFAVVADDPAMAGGIEFGNYARLVSDRMAALGYAPAADAASAQLLVKLDYGVDNGRERVRSTGFSHSPYWGPWHGYGRYGYHRPGLWNYGWHDPWFGGPDIESYTVFTSGIDLKIDRREDGQRLFEGKAEAVSRSNRLQYLVPNLIEAMFSGFPGNSGETVRISVAPEGKQR